MEVCLLQSREAEMDHCVLRRDAATGRGTAFAIRELLKALHMGKVGEGGLC